MIVFNELRIDSDKNLIIDVSVLDNTNDPQSEISIDELRIGYGSNTEVDNYDASGIRTLAANYRIDGNENTIRGFRTEIDLTSSTTTTSHPDAATSIIYVYVSVDVPNNIAVNISDCSDPTYIEGYAYDRCMLMNKVFDYIKQSDNMCDNTVNYANYIAKIKGLELAIESGNFALANKYWNKFFNIKNTSGSTFNNGCGCHR